MKKEVRRGPGQQEFVIAEDGPDKQPSFSTLTMLGDSPVVPEREHRIERLITFSDIEKQIYRRHGFEPSGVISRGLAIGSAIDYFLIPANFIYRHRANYCFPDEDDPFHTWRMVDDFRRFYPTGYASVRDKMIQLLEKYRNDFTGKENPLNPEKPVLEKGAIRERLIPLWKDVARIFGIDGLRLQAVMKKEGNILTASHETASSEGIMDIAQRIVTDRFYSLVDDDLDYSYFAKPDFLLIYEFEGKTFHIQVQPDYLKRLQDHKPSVRRRIESGEKPSKRIVAQRIVGDFKDTDTAGFKQAGPFAESMTLYRYLLTQIGEKGRLSKKIRGKLANGSVLNAFIIPENAVPLISAERVRTTLTLLKSNIESLNVDMPRFTQMDETKAIETLEVALANVS